MRDLALVVHNVRSSHNVGSILRTADGLGVTHVYLTGYTPYPLQKHDSRLPHISAKVHKQIQKTALGAEETTPWTHQLDISEVIEKLRTEKYVIAGLEQASGAIELPTWTPPLKIALIVGRETEGIEQEVLDLCDLSLEIPMLGSKESFNVAQAAAMALYHCRFH